MRPGDMTIITVESYLSGEHRELADRLMAALGLDPKKVSEIRVTRQSVVVELLQRDPRAGVFTHRRVEYQVPPGVSDADDD